MAINIADLFEHAVDVVPDRSVIQVGERKVTYTELEAEANQLAHFLIGRGIGVGDHVGIYAKNSVEHVVALLAVFKIRAVAINVNYRYVENELNYLFDNSDMVALLHERPYAPLVAATAPRHEKLTTIVAMPDPTDPHNDADISDYGAITWESALRGQSSQRDFDERSADDLYIVYTGGTTGFPKGVMWRHEDFWRVLGGGIDFMTGNRMEEYDQSKQALENEPMVTFPLSPLMHGGAQAAMLMHLFAGHLTILAPKFDADEVWRVVDHNSVQLIFMTGDAMARPLIEAYEKGGYDGSSLVAVASSAAIFSRPVK
ncbi:MAG TPA: AMP-binding protein, partial [Nocardioidaceae bacterium]|nr:AMP-binding protein [Nocardioidaceae bacterium]